ncbi:MAG: hypothetical protein KC643_08730 [Nitrospira sp.]|nr:hypothetical protein [Nitrospira sp.]
MNNWSNISWLVGILSCVFLAPLMLRVLRGWLIALNTTCTHILPALGQWAGSLGKQAGTILSEGHQSTQEIIAQTGGTILMVALGVVLGLSDLELTLSTIAPMLGATHSKTGFQFDYMIAISLVASGLVFGFVFSDIMKWTGITRFSTAEEGRASLLIFSASMLIATLSVAVVLACYRFGIMVWSETDEVVSFSGMAYTDLPFYILTTLGVLYLLGAGLALASFENLVTVVVSLSLVAACVVLGFAWALLGSAKVLGELIQSGIVEILASWEQCKSTLRDAKHQFQNREPAFKKLRVMVTKKPNPTFQKAEEPSMNDGTESNEKKSRKPSTHTSYPSPLATGGWPYQPVFVMKSQGGTGAHKKGWFD